MEIILARHGNTFNAGDKIVWVGRTEDFPLTAYGEEQARRVANYVKEKNFSAIYCAPLLRTRKFAEIISEELRMASPIVDERLLEIDYGTWAGKSDQEIIESGGKDSLLLWQKQGLWPERGVWNTDFVELKNAVTAFYQDLLKQHKEDDVVLVVSSNGTLRFFLQFLTEIPEEIRESHGKVKTGALCSLEVNSLTDKELNCNLNYWNKAV